jgi:hypothetical protein
MAAASIILRARLVSFRQLEQRGPVRVAVPAESPGEVSPSWHAVGNHLDAAFIAFNNPALLKISVVHVKILDSQWDVTRQSVRLFSRKSEAKWEPVVRSPSLNLSGPKRSWL